MTKSACLLEVAEGQGRMGGDTTQGWEIDDKAVYGGSRRAGGAVQVRHSEVERRTKPGLTSAVLPTETYRTPP